MSAERDARHKRRAALHGAMQAMAFERNTEAMRAALATTDGRGAVRLERTDAEVDTILYTAASAGADEIVPLLLAAGADVNQRNGHCRSPLMAAIRNGHASTVRLLLAAGADTRGVDRFDRTALMYAVLGLQREITRELLLSGADAIALDWRTGVTLLHRLCRSEIRNVSHYACFAELCRTGRADVNACIRGGCTPLHYACEHGLTHVAVSLIRCGAAPLGEHVGGRVAETHAAAVAELGGPAGVQRAHDEWLAGAPGRRTKAAR